MTLDDIKQATENGKTLQKLKYFNLENRWFETQKGINNDELKTFSKIKDFLAINDTGDLILRQNWIVQPSIYRNLAVNLIDAGHLGLTKIKALLRSKVFFQIWTKLPHR